MGNGGGGEERTLRSEFDAPPPVRAHHKILLTLLRLQDKVGEAVKVMVMEGDVFRMVGRCQDTHEHCVEGRGGRGSVVFKRTRR